MSDVDLPPDAHARQEMLAELARKASDANKSGENGQEPDEQ